MISCSFHLSAIKFDRDFTPSRGRVNNILSEKREDGNNKEGCHKSRRPIDRVVQAIYKSSRADKTGSD